MLDAVGITFCFAPVFHASYRFTAVPRRELGIPTTFNFLGPLVNPAKPAASAVGVADARMGPIMAGVLGARGADAFVFRGEDGLDEITTSTTSRVWIADGATGEVIEDTIDPRAFGFDYTPVSELTGGDPGVQRQGLRAGPGRRAVSPYARPCCSTRAPRSPRTKPRTGDLESRLRAGIERARESIDTGAATKVLENWARTTQTLV